MTTIKASRYNKARAILVAVGSESAAKSRDQHGVATCPAEVGAQLLRDARDEFRKTDAGLAGLVAGMTRAHYDAMHKAADTMGIVHW
jgi:hypothetical protein